MEHITRELNDRCEQRPSGACKTPRCPWVYFIQCEQFTKIGFARSVVSRFAHYKVHNPFPVNLLASFEHPEE